MPTLNTTQLVAFIKSHALTHYNAGWDVVVETMTDEDLAERLKGVTSQKGAIAAFSGIVGAFNEQRTAHRNEALAMGAEPTLQEVLDSLTHNEKRVVVAHLEAGIDCNGCETLDAMKADNMTWADVAEVSRRTSLAKNQLKGVLSSLSKKGLLSTDNEKPNGAPGVDQILTDFGLVVAFELLGEGVEAMVPAKAEKPALKVVPKAEPKEKTTRAARALEDRVMVQPAKDLREVKPMTAGSKRHLIAEALLRGTTLEHLMEVTGWKRDVVSSGLYYDMKQVGMGVERKGGKLLLILPTGVKTLPVKDKTTSRTDALVAACK